MSRNGNGLANLAGACLLGLVLLLCAPPLQGSAFHHLSRDPGDAVIHGEAIRIFTGKRVLVADTDGDRRDDLVFDASHPYGDENGAVYVVLSRPSWPADLDLALLAADLTVRGADPGDALRLEAAGDLDGDGGDDLLLVAPGGDGAGNALEDVGEACLILSGTGWAGLLDLAVDAADVVIHGAPDLVLTGGRIGDVDGDQAPDLLLSLYHAESTGLRTVLVFGNRDPWPAVIDLAAETPDLRIVSVPACHETPLAADISGDGLPDLVFGGCRNDPVRLYLGRSPRPAELDLSLTGPDATFGGLPFAVPLAGELAGDGTPDLVLSGGHSTEPGVVRVYEGGAGMGTSPPYSEILGRDPWDRLRAAGIAEVDGDGRPDLLLTARGGGERNRLPLPLIWSGEAAVLRGPVPAGVLDLGAAYPHLTIFARDGQDALAAMVAGDLDGDTATDLAIASYAGDGPGNGRENAGEIALLLSPSFAPEAPAADLYVDGDGGDDGNDGLSWARAKRTLTAALRDLDFRIGPVTVRVSGGVYTEGILLGSGTRLQGGYPPGGGDREPAGNPTEIRSPGPAFRPVVMAPASPLEPIHLDGFTLTGGGADRGGAVYVLGGSPVITNNVLTGNEAVYRIQNEMHLCTDPDNGASHYAVYCGASCSGKGTAVFAEKGASPRITNNLIHGNSLREVREFCLEPDPGIDCVQTGGCPEHLADPPRGGAVAAEAPADLVVRHNTVYGNTGSGVLIEGAGPQSAVVRDNILWANHLDLDVPDGGAEVTCNVIGSSAASPGPSNLTDDPLFVDAPGGDFRLQEPDAGQPGRSPAVDAGSGEASSLCLDEWQGEGPACLDALTTRTDGVPDAGRVDIGFHYARPNGPPVFAGATGAEAAGDCNLRVSWRAAHDPEGDDPVRYSIYRSMISGGQDFQNPAATVEAPALEWTDTGAPWGQSLYYVVRAGDSGGREESNLVEVSATPEDRSPPEVQVVSAAPDFDCVVRIVFQASDGCSGLPGWELHRSDAAGFAPGPSTRVATNMASPWGDTVPSNGIWYYRLTAGDNAGNQAVSAQEAVRVSACDATPVAPGEARILDLRRTASQPLVFEIGRADGADFHRLYRGGLDDLAAAGYGHEASVGDDRLEDTPDDRGNCRFDGNVFEDPAGGAAGSFYYLVVGVNSAGEGLYGTGSDEIERPGGTRDCP